MKAQIFNFSDWISETDPQTLAGKFGGALKESGFKILGELEHFFFPQGYTKLWLLGESHFALHTFPEENKTYIELSSCNKEMFERFKTLI